MTNNSRGRKICPQCGSSVGVRTITCFCKYVFVKRNEKSKANLKELLIVAKNRLEELLNNQEEMKQRLFQIDVVIKVLEEVGA